jgi:hypothetical protein
MVVMMKLETVVNGTAEVNGYDWVGPSSRSFAFAKLDFLKSRWILFAARQYDIGATSTLKETSMVA